MLFLLLEILVPERKRESRPVPALALSARAASSGAAAALLLLSAGTVLGSPSSALREYKAGQYEQALKEYEKLLQKKGDDPRLHFNAGAAAYRNHQFDEAAKQFNEAVATPDLKLQQLSYYNRGNAQYWLGEKNPDPTKRTDLWKKAVKDFELSMKLNPQDPDARFNHEFVKKRLEELEQQKQQQKQQDKQDQKDDQSKQDQKQQQQQNQDKQDKQDQQQQQQQQQQDQQGSQQDQKDQQGKQEQQKQQDQQQQNAASQPQDPKQDQQQGNQAAAEQNEQSGETNGQASAAGEMTPEQARQLLDAQKGDEKMLSQKPEGKPNDREKPFKDW